ncbi:MAG: lipase [Aequorivita sp.]|nr:lipase [Aequorivita sp.]MBF31443.1 lipase [Aequorivita sp.]|tara:strand:+ start:103572 stop:104669 length:1098 start_codon:yes stop_codon:yes gene_type:complete
MKKLYAVALFFLAISFPPNIIFAQCGDVTLESLTNPGPYEVATLTEADGLRNGPDYAGATVYYPTNATPPFASIAIVPGFTALPSSVEEWGPFYASHGIVTIIIGTNSLFDFPEQRATALLDALETMRQENTRSTSPLENQLDVDKFAVSGWSMGGGGAQRAAVLDNTIKGVVALCPWLPNASLNHDSPVLIFSGENDPTAPPAEHADIHYNVTPNTTDKLLFEVANGNHSVANSPTGGDDAVGKIALSWLKLYVDDNDCYCPLLTEELLVNPPAASKVLSSFECELVLGVAENTVDISLYPNPTQDFVYINVSKVTYYEVYSALGQRLLSGKLTQGEKQIDFSNFAQGLYYVRVSNETMKVIRE